MEVSYGVKGEIIIDRKNVVICSGTVWMVIAVRFNIKLASLLLPARRGIHRAGADFVHSSRVLLLLEGCLTHLRIHVLHLCQTVVRQKKEGVSPF